MNLELSRLMILKFMKDKLKKINLKELYNLEENTQIICSLLTGTNKMAGVNHK